MGDRQRLTLWVLYEKPLDFPEHFVIRAHDVNLAAGTVSVRNEHFLAKRRSDIEAAFFLHHPTVTWIGRQPEDGPQIVGVWV